VRILKNVLSLIGGWNLDPASVLVLGTSCYSGAIINHVNSDPEPLYYRFLVCSRFYLGLRQVHAGCQQCSE